MSEWSEAEQDRIDAANQAKRQPAPSQTGTPKCEDCGFAMARGELDRSGQEYFCPVCAKAGIRMAENKRLREELSQAKRDAERQWMSIESAPSEQDVLITQIGSPMVWCAYRLEDEWYLPGDDASFVVTPTHWMPLPTALAKREGEGEK